MIRSALAAPGYPVGMSHRTARLLLFALFALVVPLPFFLVQTGAVPAARILMLAGIVVALIAAEGMHGMIGIAAGLLLLQLAVYAALLFGAAHWAARGLARAWPQHLALATAALAAVALLVASSCDLYRTPFRTHSLHASLLRVFE